MSSLLIVFLSIVLVVNAAFLMLLILIQLPKKEAGAGLAFGAGATDALFGAGSGNALTRMTKYAATAFLGLVLLLSFLSQRHANSGSRTIDAELKKKAASAASTLSNVTAVASTTASSNLLKSAVGLSNAANAVTQATTNAQAPSAATAPATTTPAPATPAK